MVRSVLLHWHPQGAYFGRAIVHSLQYLNVQPNDLRLIVLVGSSFLSHTVESSLHFINLLKDQIEGKGIQSIEIEIIPKFMWSFSNFREVEKNKKIIEESKILISKMKEKDSIFKLFTNSISDSLSRGLDSSFSNFDYMINQVSARDLESHRELYAATLTNIYINILSKYQPELITTSHGNYDHYITPFIASTLKRIPTLIVNGGCNMAYVHNPNVHQLADPCIANAFKEIVERETSGNISLFSTIPPYLKEEIQAASNTYVKNSSCRSIKNSKIFNEYKKDSTYPLAILPIFAELSNHDCLGRLEFPRKYDWLVDMFRLASEANKKLYIYEHPATKSYGQNDLTKALIQSAGSIYDVEYEVVKGLNMLSEILNRNSLIPFSLGSSIALELYATGGYSVISNTATCSPISESHFVFKKGMNYFDLEDIFFKNIDVRSKSKVFISMADFCLRFNSFGKFRSQDFHLRKAFDKLFYFGGFRTDSPKQFLKLFHVYMNSLDFQILETKSFHQFILK